ncbi:craniofacial development protein 2-like [Penaeus japonicus]|uniref:craniofacial development protein 2-like n=1 Tax=Penaeus japonicus TaxID=27405 RepID=UPI001C717798|nr:craniofacial development protein 2-like [Penaeus japonicus]
MCGHPAELTIRPAKGWRRSTRVNGHPHPAALQVMPFREELGPQPITVVAEEHGAGGFDGTQRNQHLVSPGNQIEGSKAKEIGSGYKLFYYGTNNKRNGVGIILDPEPSKGIMEVNRESDRLISIKIQVDNVLIDITSAYAPQTGCDEGKKDEFSDKLGSVLQSVPSSEVLWVYGDLNGRVGEGINGSSDCMGKHGVGVRNKDGDRIVDWATAGGMALVNTYFMKSEQQKRRQQHSDKLYCMQKANDVLGCKVLPVKNVAKKHRPLVCKIEVRIIRSKQPKGIRKTKWFKESEYQEEFVQKVETELKQGDKNWETVTDKIRKIVKEILGETSGSKKSGERDLVVERRGTNGTEEKERTQEG